MYKVKVYQDNYDKSEFYSIMGKYFAERVYKRTMPYLVNDKNKIWYLFYSDTELVGFCGVKIGTECIEFSYVYPLVKDEYDKVLKFMCERIYKLYKNNNIRILTDNKMEIAVWKELGFNLSGTKGKYQYLENVSQTN